MKRICAVLFAFLLTGAASASEPPKATVAAQLDNVIYLIKQKGLERPGIEVRRRGGDYYVDFDTIALAFDISYLPPIKGQSDCEVLFTVQDKGEGSENGRWFIASDCAGSLIKAVKGDVEPGTPLKDSQEYFSVEEGHIVGEKYRTKWENRYAAVVTLVAMLLQDKLYPTQAQAR